MKIPFPPDFHPPKHELDAEGAEDYGAIIDHLLGIGRQQSEGEQNYAEAVYLAGVSREIAADAASEYRAQGGSTSSPRQEEATKSGASRVTLLKGSDITPKPINWLWPGYLASGKLHVLGGAPGSGKTTIAMSFAATVTNGSYWPDKTRAPVGNVFIWSGEDDPTDTLTPRLIAAGADMSRVYFVGDTFDGGKARSFDPSKDIAPLASAIREVGGASLIVVDPIVSAVAGDSHKNSETRRALQPLVDLAASVGAALVGITHFSKGSACRDPTERITGSLAFSALARVVLIAAKAPGENEDDPAKRVFMRAKSNIGTDSGGFEYDLQQVDLDGYSGLSASRVEWGEQIDGSARDVLSEAEAATKAEGGAVGEASAFLRAILADGPMAAGEAQKAAQAAGLSLASVRRAKVALGVKSKRSGYGAGGAFEWSLPDHRRSTSPIDAQQNSVGINGSFEHQCSGDDLEVEI